MGSSPLTRGKPDRGASINERERLIPAHAGKTLMVRPIHSRMGAHPRSRGENGTRSDLAYVTEGSSPLTRGKPRPPPGGRSAPWLIPAHAGKTDSGNRSWIISRAHPRSRGENGKIGGGLGAHQGSSPLTRGKHRHLHGDFLLQRLIPAHAGKTPCYTLVTGVFRAHPRSRGENNLVARCPGCAAGSSPLTRGKLGADVGDAGQVGLIPAHAGKTFRWYFGLFYTGAHPRSRGENLVSGQGHALAQGSSPLTRGKLACGLAGRASGRLIPAHAGKTGRPRNGGCPPRAHPRSRGENSSSPSWSVDFRGSSPLTRGKRGLVASWSEREGLIPAHAGKTITTVSRHSVSSAHPRSRGENSGCECGSPGEGGSSPLTRGKRGPAGWWGLPGWLIPAHAGKTAWVVAVPGRWWAHPRSRGENQQAAIEEQKAKGSSPLTRGKRRPEGRGRGGRRLIPAHAGKTSVPCRSRPGSRAHPRSRGENDGASGVGQASWGSSPLTRGKLDRRGRLEGLAGLIPAHAGKTFHDDLFSLVIVAHPRSRGENVSTARAMSYTRGSSPLTRGKLEVAHCLDPFGGLIPAHAGKTHCLGPFSVGHRAHPRSRGENFSRPKVTPLLPGSSPLTRGKLVGVEGEHERVRLIPAHAGKTVATSRTTTSRRAHPRSRGENGWQGSPLV